MANRSLLLTSLIFLSVLTFPVTGFRIVSGFVNLVGFGIDYFLASFKSIITEILEPPRNRNDSLSYALYTPSSPMKPCYLEPNLKALRRCPFNAKLPLKILIHGFVTTDPILWDLKNSMLQLYDYNVIIMDWRKYNKPLYVLASLNTQLIGCKLANLLHFLKVHKRLKPTNIHLIGHSLGAHLSGVAGKYTPNLGRISGLDPALPLFSFKSLLHRLTYRDATFVDVIHTSNDFLGLGVPVPLGHQDFFPNGGSDQPECFGDQYRATQETNEQLGKVNSGGLVDLIRNICDHQAAIRYYIDSVNPAKCLFLAVMCDSYEDFLKGVCSNGQNILTPMGLFAHKIPGIGPRKEFFLRTSSTEPFCLKDGYKPE